MKKALITGITGQDGSYLSELLINKGYEVHGIIRRTSTPNTSRIDHILDDLCIHTSDITDQSSISRIIRDIQPDEIYNLAAQSFVHTSFDNPSSTADVTALGVTRMLEAIRNECPHSRFYQASSSEMFGKVQETPQSESTPFYPRSPYGISKLYGHWSTINYRESYGLFCVSGILFNHESPRRGLEFVTRKITHAAAKIKLGLQDRLYLGNLNAARDWGHARDYVELMWMMLQSDTPEDYVIGTGESHTVKEFVKLAFESLDMDYRDYVEIDPRFYRPAEVDILLADPSKAKSKLKWINKTSFEELVHEMVDEDISTLYNE